ncbi:DUF6036 family nucleotidyltransferase [Rubritalea spongiae]|uniref:DUF6036 family nucleotidyltransferase n=1 Tax=Rubritalea spongiae TaxID=430797 RepID=A0ABW5DXW1_9BACT
MIDEKENVVMSTQRELFEADLKTALRAAAKAYDRKRFVVVGSASILASHPDAPGYLRLSADIDMFPLRKLKTETFKPGDDLVGQASEFEHENDFYVERVGDWTMLSQPAGWLERCVQFKVDHITGYCLSPIDLAYNKTEAGRKKDIDFVAGMINEGIIGREELGIFIQSECPHPDLLPTVEKNFEVVCAELDHV